MFSSVPMTQINVASPVSKLDDVLSVMENLDVSHPAIYSIRRWRRNRASTWRRGTKEQFSAKLRHVSSGQLKVSNEGGSMSSAEVEKLLSGGFEESMDSASSCKERY